MSMTILWKVHFFLPNFLKVIKTHINKELLQPCVQSWYYLHDRKVYFFIKYPYTWVKNRQIWWNSNDLHISGCCPAKTFHDKDWILKFNYNIILCFMKKGINILYFMILNNDHVAVCVHRIMGYMHRHSTMIFVAVHVHWIMGYMHIHLSMIMLLYMYTE